MKIISSFLFLILFFKASANTDTAFVYTYGKSGHDFARQIMCTSDSGYIIVGSTSSAGAGTSDMYVIKTDRNCNREWSQVYGTSAIEWGYGVRETSDHGFALIGFTNQNISSGYDALLIKISATGDMQWSKTFGGTDWDFGYAIENANDGGFIICGSTYSPSNGGEDMLIIKADSVGNVVWKKNIGGANDEEVHSIIKDQYSNYLILGETNSFGAGDKDYYLVKINEDGDTLWTKTYGGANFDAGYSIDTTIDGNYLVFGTSKSFPGPTDKQMYLLKTDTSGIVLHSQVDGGSNTTGNDEEGRFAKQLSNGEMVIGGMTQSYGLGGKSLFMLHFLSNGNFDNGANWGGTDDDEGFSMAVGKDGQLVFAGITTSYGFGLEDVYLIRIDSFAGYFPLSIHTFNDEHVGVNEIAGEQNFFSIYPNPCANSTSVNFTKSISGKKYELKIVDVMGKEIENNIIKKFPVTISKGQELQSGIYFVSIYEDDLLQATDKLVIF